jgi:hypothetical protein
MEESTKLIEKIEMRILRQTLLNKLVKIEMLAI